MDISLLFVIILTLITIVVFFNDIIPQCNICKKFKPRHFYKILVRSGFGMNCKSHVSVCKKCSRKYALYSLKDYEQYKQARRSIRPIL